MIVRFWNFFPLPHFVFSSVTQEWKIVKNATIVKGLGLESETLRDPEENLQPPAEKEKTVTWTRNVVNETTSLADRSLANRGNVLGLTGETKIVTARKVLGSTEA